MRKFDTKVQYLKYKVLREVAKQAWAGRQAFGNHSGHSENHRPGESPDDALLRI